MKTETRYSVATSDGKLRYFGAWPHPDGRYQNFALMQQGAREALEAFDAERVRIQSDERLTEIGRREALNAIAAEHLAKREEWLNKRARPAKAKLVEELGKLKGGRPRAKDDASGQLADMELRQWYSRLSGQELITVNGRLQRGEMPELASAIARMPAEVSGARPDIHAVACEQAVAPENLEQVAALEEHLQAIEFAEQAWDVTRQGIQELASGAPIIAKDRIDQALADAGLEKVGERQVAKLSAPEIAELERSDGILDRSDGAAETAVVDRIYAGPDGKTRIVPTKIAADAPFDSEVGGRTRPSAA